MIAVRTTSHSGHDVTTAETLTLSDEGRFRYRVVRIVGDFGSVEQERDVSPTLASQIWERMNGGLGEY